MNIKEKKNIWIFHHYATPPTLNGFTRPYDFGRNLIDQGHEVTVFASSRLHFTDENILENDDLYTINNETEVPFIFINTPSVKKNMLSRLKNMFSYYIHLFKVTKQYLGTHKVPDVIIASSPHPLTLLAGIKIAKKMNIPCICEIRDFWPEVFFMNNVLKENSLIGKLLLKGEYWLYQKADALIFLKEGDYKYLTEKKWDTDQNGLINLNKSFYINNGINIESNSFERKQYKLVDKDLSEEGFKVVYTGAIRPVNDINKLIEAAILLKENQDIKFLIYGEGSELQKLEEKCKKEQLSNVKLKGYIDKKYIPYVLSNASVNILNYSQEKYNWSRGNSSNKLFEYLASGKPIISTVKMGYSIIDKYNCGVSLENGTPEELAEAILLIKNIENKDYLEMSNNARNISYKFDYKELSEKLLEVINFVTE